MRRTLLWLFLIALLARVFLSVVRVLYGVPATFSIGVPWFAPIQTYDDFDSLYVRQLGFLGQGLLPYRDFAYSYPPLFLLALYPFYAVGTSSAAAIPIIVFDAATSPLVYLIGLRYRNNRVALAASLFYALSPFALLYEGFLWFGSQPMTFFLVLSVYMLTKENVARSSFALGLASLLRSDALFILPAYAIECLRIAGRKALRGIAAVVAMMTLASVPFLLLSPGQYLYLMSYGILARLFPSLADSISSTARSSGEASLQGVGSGQSGSYQCAVGTCYPGATFQLATIPGSPISSFVMEQAARILVPSLLALVFVALFASRRSRNSFALASSFSLLVFLALFSFSVHPLFRYYLIPVFAVLLAACTKPLAFVAVSTSSVISILLPETSFQAVLPLLAILAVIVAEDASRRTNDEASGCPPRVLSVGRFEAHTASPQPLI